MPMIQKLWRATHPGASTGFYLHADTEEEARAALAKRFPGQTFTLVLWHPGGYSTVDWGAALTEEV